MRIFIVIFIFLLQTTTPTQTKSEKLNKYCIEDKLPIKDGSKTNVYAILKIDSMSPINQNTLEIDTQLLIELFWKEEIFSQYESLEDQDPNFTIPNRQIVQDHYWIPDLEIFGTTQHEGDASKQNIDFSSINYFGDGYLNYKIKLSVKLLCGRYFYFYPLDKQSCDIKMNSMAFMFDEVELFWSERQGEVNDPLFHNWVGLIL